MNLTCQFGDRPLAAGSARASPAALNLSNFLIEKHNLARMVFLQAFVEQAKSSGLLSHWIEKHGAYGLSPVTSA